MISPFRVIKNVILLGARKIRYGSHYKTGFLQGYDKLHVEIHNKGSIHMGKYNQNRGNLHLIADGGNITIGDRCYFNTGCCVTALESVTIGNYCRLGNNMILVDHDHRFDNVAGEHKGQEEYNTAPVSIGDFTWIGANSTILKGATIGKNCVIAAGSVVRGNIPDGTILVQKREDKWIEHH